MFPRKFYSQDSNFKPTFQALSQDEELRDILHNMTKVLGTRNSNLGVNSGCSFIFGLL